jgi:NAD(P)-dependent dehydrogenase (short-subunit alcohol dehydrogenase family)
MSQRVVVITGGLGALGSAVASAATAKQLQTIIVDHARATREPPPSAMLLEGIDLSNAAAADKAIETIINHFGGIDVLLNIAGAFRYCTLETGSSEDWETMFRINVKTTVNATRAALAALKAGPAGRIVNIGAGAAETGGAGMGPYAASKSAVHRLTESLAAELKHDRVTVNAVLPSIIDTPQNRKDMPDADFSTWVKPADLADVLLLLASEESRAISGALIRVPGRV